MVDSRRHRLANGAIVYDGSRADQGNGDWFEPQWWSQRSPTPGGRGSAWFVECDDLGSAVLRPYRRGGLIGRILSSSYLWLGAANTRPLREWQLLTQLLEKNLPVAAPIAARYRRRGLVYSAEILTERVAGSRTLAEVVEHESPAVSLWESLGREIARFHSHGVYHADLNAHNVLVTEAGEIYLIDFDRGRIRPPSKRWRRSNLKRLRRSLGKIGYINRDPQAFEVQWARLKKSYVETLDATRAMPGVESALESCDNAAAKTQPGSTGP